MVKIINTGNFDLMYRQLIQEDPNVADYVLEAVEYFKRNSDDTRLDNHKLTKSKKLIGRWAFSITDDIRIVYEWIGKTTVRFLAIGGHQKVYQRRSK